MNCIAISSSGWCRSRSHRHRGAERRDQRRRPAKGSRHSTAQCRFDRCSSLASPAECGTGSKHLHAPNGPKPRLSKNDTLFRCRPEEVWLVGVTGRYLKQWEPDWLRTVIAKVDAAPTRRVREGKHLDSAARLTPLLHFHKQSCASDTTCPRAGS